MEKLWKYLPPEQMTPEERETRVIELLTLASVKLALEQKNKKETAATSTNPGVTIASYPKRGPIPFGFSWIDGKIVVNDEEMKWIRRIKELASDDKSTEEIAERLNQEDQTSRRVGEWNRTAVWRILKLIKGRPVQNKIRF